MRFTSVRDYSTILNINKELVNTVVDTPVVIYKLHQQLTKTNSYGEATKKTWYVGVEVPALIDRKGASTSQEMQTLDVKQEAIFYFLRQELVDRKVFPEQGDIIHFDAQYYEVHMAGESEIFAGRTEYKHMISCECHLSRLTNLQLEPPTL